jgi:N-acetylmuramoyl-L-alanine amidase
MKQTVALFAAALIVLGGLTARAALINGHSYTPLGDWARATDFYGFTRDNGHEIILTNRTARMVFDVDSPQAAINGVNVRLSFPVANVRGVPFISQLDLDKTIRPLLYPSRYIAPKRITTICLDPGHGGKDTGNRVGFGFFSHNEKTYTLALALELQRQLQASGFKVILTRTSDKFVELPARPDIANQHGADLFVSLHFNAAQAGKDEVEGPETYCITPVGAASSNSQGEGSDYGMTPANRCEYQSLLLAYQMEKSLVRNLGVGDRGVRRARFAVLRDAQMPAILIEGGYMTHPTESKRIFDAGYRRQMAAAIVRGIQAYQKITSPAVAPAMATNYSTPKPSGASHHFNN